MIIWLFGIFFTFVVFDDVSYTMKLGMFLAFTNLALIISLII